MIKKGDKLVCVDVDCTNNNHKTKLMKVGGEYYAASDEYFNRAAERMMVRVRVCHDIERLYFSTRFKKVDAETVTVTEVLETKHKVPAEIKRNGKIFTPTGEFRKAKVGEHYLEGDNIYTQCCAVVAYVSAIYEEKKPWRSGKKESYYFVCAGALESPGAEPLWSIESGDVIDELRYTAGNYYQTEELAQEAADKINAIFKGLI